MKFRKIRNNKILSLIIVVSLSAGMFFATYKATVFFNNKETQKANAKISNEKVLEKTDNALKDAVEIVFTRRTEDGNVLVDYKTNIKELKKSYNMENITEEDLEKAAKEQGFKKVSSSEKEFIFVKDNNNNKLEANKYYLGDKDGFIAIYKTDENGSLTVEKTEDVSAKKISELPEVDGKQIKNFEMKFDSKEDCEEALTNFVS